MIGQIAFDEQLIADFCLKWRVVELAIFGSALRSDFGPHSDVDLLVSFEEGAPWSLWDLSSMRDELSQLFGRRVDLVEKRAIKNPFRRRSILGSYEVIHAA